MNFRTIIIWIGIVVYFSPFHLATAQFDFVLEHIGYEKGLIYHRIEELTQDKKGFLWIASEYGLFRYDGSKFKLYQYGDQETDCQNPGSVHNITKDSNGEIWTGDYTLHVYDRARDHFWSYLPDPLPQNWHIISLNGDSHQNIWIGTAENGLYRFDIRKKQFNSINEAFSSLNTLGAISEIVEDQEQKIWFCDANSIFRLDPQTNQVDRFALRENFSVGYNDGFVKSLFVDSQGTVWIGTSKGIYFFEKTNSLIRRLSDHFLNPISSFGEPRPGLIWAYGLGQSYFINYEPTETSGFSIIKADPPQLQDETITSFYRGNKGDFWIGTMNNGIYQWSPYFKRFQKYDRISERRSYTLQYLELEDGQILISADSIILFDPIKNRFSRENAFTNIPVKGILHQHPDGWIWIASWQGLTKFNPKTQKVIKYKQDPNDPTSIQGESVPALLIDRNGDVWVGIWGQGLYRYRSDTDDFEAISLIDSLGHTHSGIWSLYEDSRGNIWVGNLNGVVKLRPDHSIGAVFDFNAYAFYEDKMHRIWIASGQGLIRIDSTEIRKWNTTNGLPHNWVNTIAGDDRGFLWLGTADGLSRFNPESETILNFTIDDGLPGKVVWSSFKTRSGELYFGFKDGGMLRFHPDSIKLNPVIPEITITEFHINNKLIPFSDQIFKEISDHTPGFRNSKLDWSENDISFSFAALNFVSPQKNRYKFKLANYDHDWTNTDQKRPFATYTNLDPGNYIFQVIGSNNDGVWNEEGVKMEITIVPPWWWNTWSKLFYFLVTALALWFIRRYERNREKLQYALQVEKLKSEKLSEVDQLKTRFFSNISHELKTPISLITGPVNELLKRSRREERKYLNIIQGNAERLRSLVDQLLDLTRIDANKITLQARELDVISFCRKIFQFYISEAEKKDIKYTFKTGQLGLLLYFDPDKLEKVINNLMSNAFKFTPEGGEIMMQVEGSEDKAYVSVLDSGPGISKTDLPSIFERFFQVDNSQTRLYEGTGIGLSLARELTELHGGKINVESVVGKGSRFDIILPLGKEHLKPEQIVSSTASFDSSTTLLGNYNASSLPDPHHLVSNVQLPTLLIVEDNDDMREYLKLLLIEEYQILESSNGEQALSVSRDKLPDLIISDVMMPKMTGYEFCDQLKSDILTCHIPILLLTVKSDLESRLESFEKGADAYLSKPFESKELLTRIKSLLASKQRIRDYYQSTLITQSTADAPNVKDPLIQNLNDLIHKNLDDADFGIMQICRKMTISRAQLYRKVDALTGLSVGQYINNIKMNRALELLKASNLNISEIAYSTGFKDPAYFSRQFKKTFGKRPSEIR